MIKQKTILEIKIGERAYELCVPSDAPLGELFDAVCQMQSMIVSKINESQEKPKAPEVVQEENKIEELPQV